MAWEARLKDQDGKYVLCFFYSNSANSILVSAIEAIGTQDDLIKAKYYSWVEIFNRKPVDCGITFLEKLHTELRANQTLYEEIELPGMFASYADLVLRVGAMVYQARRKPGTTWDCVYD